MNRNDFLLDFILPSINNTDALWGWVALCRLLIIYLLFFFDSVIFRNSNQLHLMSFVRINYLQQVPF